MEIRSKFKKSEFFIGGDFNLPDIDWTKSEIKEGRYKIELTDSSEKTVFICAAGITSLSGRSEEILRSKRP